MTETLDHRNEAFHNFADDINAFLRTRYRYKSMCVHARHPTVDVARAAVRLYLRFRVGKSWDAGSIVIAVIQFKDQRRGHGRALLSKLIDLAPKYGYQNIAIEQTGSDPSIQAFVRKFGFKNSCDERNWIVSVGELSNALLSSSTAPRRVLPGSRVDVNAKLVSNALE